MSRIELTPGSKVFIASCFLFYDLQIHVIRETHPANKTTNNRVMKLISFAFFNDDCSCEKVIFVIC